LICLKLDNAVESIEKEILVHAVKVVSWHSLSKNSSMQTASSFKLYYISDSRFLSVKVRSF